MVMQTALNEIQDNGDLYYVTAQILKAKEMWAEYKQCMELAMQNHETLSITPKEASIELEKNMPKCSVAG